MEQLRSQSGFWASLMWRLKKEGGSAPADAWRLDDVRRAMLALLDEDGARRYPLVAHRIRRSKDAKALWFQRANLMAALSDLYGEEKAHERMQRLTGMFKGLLPKGMMVQPALGRRHRK